MAKKQSMRMATRVAGMKKASEKFAARDAAIGKAMNVTKASEKFAARDAAIGKAMNVTKTYKTVKRKKNPSLEDKDTTALRINSAMGKGRGRSR